MSVMLVDPRVCVVLEDDRLSYARGSWGRWFGGCPAGECHVAEPQGKCYANGLLGDCHIGDITSFPERLNSLHSVSEWEPPETGLELL